MENPYLPKEYKEKITKIYHLDRIQQLQNQIIKERKELHNLDGMDYYIKAAHITGLYKSIILHTISQPNPNLSTKTKTMKNTDQNDPASSVG